VLRFRLMEKRGHRGDGLQASEGEGQHGLSFWTGRFDQGHERLYCGWDGQFEARARELVENLPDVAELVEPLLIVRRVLRERLLLLTKIASRRCDRSIHR